MFFSACWRVSESRVDVSAARSINLDQSDVVLRILRWQVRHYSRPRGFFEVTVPRDLARLTLPPFVDGPFYWGENDAFVIEPAADGAS